MAVYVDDAVWGFGRMVMCHAWSDSLEELLAMMDTIGVQRRWIQGHPTLSFGKHKNASWCHFDISKGKRELAIRHGAIACDRYAALLHSVYDDIKSPDPILQQHGYKRRRLALYARAKGKVVFRFSRLYTQLMRPEGI